MSNDKSNKKNKARIRIRDRGRPAVLTMAPSYTGTLPRVGLYAFVYNGLTSFFVSVLLVISFFLQGVYVVHANEVDGEVVVIETPPAPTETTQVPEPIPEPAHVVTEESVDDIELQSSEQSDEFVLDTETITPQPESSGDVIPPVTSPEDIASSSLEVLSDELVDTPSIEPEIDGASTTVPLTEEQTSGGGSPVQDNVDTDDSVPDEEVVEEVNQVSDEAIEVVSDEDTSQVGDESIEEELIGPGLTEPITISYTDSGYTFSKSECTELASGSFYCVEPKENILDDALFAAPDADGDLEIFLVRDGVQSQVTQNQVDDAAPYYDQNSETIVWHRLVDDRYQIVSYDVATAEETLLTKNATNDMEPTRQGKYTVWQRWVGNNWDIILYDGNSETQISHATAHDIAPYIHGTLVVWNRYTMTGDKTIEMYDIATETYVTVDDPAGLSVSNPRMVLVYDQMHPNGDVVTKGYDMIAKKFIQLDTLPRDLPDSIPESEPTSETRALIQAKPTVKGDEVVVTSGDGDGEPLVPPVVPDTAPDPLTLDLTATSTDVISQDLQPVTEFDLVIEPLSSSTSSESGVQATSTE